MQIYRYMDIGTDKPTLEDRMKVPHHLVDIKYPDEPWSVEEFQQRAAEALESIWSRGRIPLIVGGTGFYIRAFLRGFPLRDAPPDPGFRREMEELASREGKAAVHALLRDVDPESWRLLHPNDLKRVVRALEYYRATGRRISERRHLETKSPLEALMIGLRWNREELNNRIDARVDAQFRRGLVEETWNLFKMGYSPELPSMQGLGYKEVCFMLQGLCTLDEAKYLIKRNTRRFAKRQFTWFKQEPGIIWFTLNQDKLWRGILDDVSITIDKWIHTLSKRENSEGN